MSDARMVKIAELWQRKSAKGTTYFSGFLGDAQLLLFRAGERAHPTRPDESVIVWKLLVQERDPARRAQRQEILPPVRRPQAALEMQRPAEPPPFDDDISDLGR